MFSNIDIIIVMALLIYPARLTSTFFHELSHLIVVKMAGWKVIHFKPYPCSFANKRYNGVVVYEVPEDLKNYHYMPFVYSAPLWMNFILIQVFVVLSFSCYLPLFIFVAAFMFDYVCWWWEYLFDKNPDSNSDGASLRRFTRTKNDVK